MSGGDELFTPEERGQSNSRLRWVTRVIVLALVAGTTVAIVVGSNLVAERGLPWAAEPERASVLADGATAPEPATTDLAARVEGEDLRLATLARMDAADPRTRAEFGTLVLGARAEPYGLPDLIAAGAVRQDAASTYTLLTDVMVRAGAELVVHAPGARIQLLSTPDATVSVVGWGGNVTFAGAEGDPLTVTSWDPEAGSPDRDLTEGRAYIRVRDAALRATDASFEHLGYWSGRTGGLAVGATDFGFAAVALERTVHVGLHYGFFGSSLAEGTITGATVAGSVMTGIALTNHSRNVAIDGAGVTDSGGDGIRVDRASSAVRIAGATVTGSRGTGIRVDGSALADGPSIGGYATTPARDVSVVGGTVRDNASGGVWLTSVDQALIQNTTVEAVDTAVRVDGPADEVRIEGGAFASTEYRGLRIADGVSAAVVDRVEISGPRVAMEVKDASVALTNSALAVTTGHAVELSDGARMDIVGNTFTGTGQDSVLATGGAQSVVRDNDASGWRFQLGFVAWMNERPMMWMWAFVLLIPALGLPLLARRRRKHRELRRLLEDAIIDYGQSQIAAYRAARDAATDAATEDVDTSTPPPPHEGLVSAASGSRGAATPTPTPSRDVATRRPRSFRDLRTGPLAGREFDSLRQFAVAAVLEAGYPVATIARLFRVPSWRLQEWVEGVLESPDATPTGRRTPAGRR